MKDFIILKTFHIQWINHPVLGLKSQYVAEDLLFEDFTTDLKSLTTAEHLDYGDAMLHFVGSTPCLITRDRDLRLPIGQ